MPNSPASESFLTVQAQFAQSIRDPENSHPPIELEERRLNVYRELFFNNVESFAASAFPVLKELLLDSDWQRLVRHFFIQHKCETPYFLEISEEFLGFLEEAVADKQTFGFLPVYAWQLAHWEWMELHADIADAQTSMLISNVSEEALLDSHFVLSDTVWCCAYEYPVHQISADNSDVQEVPTYLMVYRNGLDDVGFNELNPLSAALFESLRQNPSLSGREVLSGLAEQSGLDADVVLEGGKSILAQWQKNCVLFAQ